MPQQYEVPMENTKNDTKPTGFTIPAGTWGSTKTKLKNKFSQLSDTDLHFVEGQESELTARLRTKLNKSEAEVQQLITEL